MKKIYIHIGNFKTASTSIQNFIFLNRNLFNKNNVQVLIEEKKNAPLLNFASPSSFPSLSFRLMTALLLSTVQSSRSGQFY